MGKHEKLLMVLKKENETNIPLSFLNNYFLENNIKVVLKKMCHPLDDKQIKKMAEKKFLFHFYFHFFLS